MLGWPGGLLTAGAKCAVERRERGRWEWLLCYGNGWNWRQTVVRSRMVWVTCSVTWGFGDAGVCTAAEGRVCVCPQLCWSWGRCCCLCCHQKSCRCPWSELPSEAMLICEDGRPCWTGPAPLSCLGWADPISPRLLHSVSMGELVLCVWVTSLWRGGPTPPWLPYWRWPGHRQASPGGMGVEEP